MRLPTKALAGDAEPVAQEAAVPVFGRRNMVVAAIMLGMAFLMLIAFEARFAIQIAGISAYPHFVYQAEAFLHGRWDLSMPAQATDIVVVHGKHYIVYPPFPALLLVPFVAIFGLSTSDVLFTTVMSAFNLPLLYLLFEQLRANGWTRRIWLENIIIAIFCFMGSISFYLSLGGRMWFTAHIVCMCFTLLSLLVAFRGRYGWSAVLLGCAFFSRSTVALGFPLLYYLAAQDNGRADFLQRFVASVRARKIDWSVVPWRRLVPPLAVTCAVVALFLARNQIVFGSPFESGYNILLHQRYPTVTSGPFNLSYIPSNIVANFLTFPQVTFTGPFDRHPMIDLIRDGNGMSPFVTTPLFLLLFAHNRHFSTLRAALWMTLGLIVLAILAFHAAGWYEFGSRYLVDAYPYAFVLLALNEVRVDWRFALLGFFGIAINALGAAEFWTGHVFKL
jgi:hypothetical protein